MVMYKNKIYLSNELLKLNIAVQLTNFWDKHSINIIVIIIHISREVTRKCELKFKKKLIKNKSNKYITEKF